MAGESIFYLFWLGAWVVVALRLRQARAPGEHPRPTGDGDLGAPGSGGSGGVARDPCTAALLPVGSRRYVRTYPAPFAYWDALDIAPAPVACPTHP